MQAQAEYYPIEGADLDEEALAVWALAARIGGRQPPSEPERSFTSLLLALLHDPNPLSRWFLRYCAAAGVQLHEVRGKLDFDPTALRQQQSGSVESGSSKHAAREGWTSSTANIATGASELLRAASSPSNPYVGVRHVLGAYFYRLPTDHQRQMEDWGFVVSREASALLRQIRLRWPAEADAWIEEHKRRFKEPPALEASDPLPPPRVSGFASDSPDGTDQLDIEDDVYALSALICSTRITPPLSIGLFGNWGSGKSFFIRQLQKGAAWISQQARVSDKLQRDVPFYKYVVQIEFNAWNYSAGNLWAALVQHILENLRLTSGEPEAVVEERRKRLQAQMDLQMQVHAATEARVKQAEAELQAVRQQLTASRVEHDQKVQELSRLRFEDVSSTIKLPDATKEQVNRLLEELGLVRAADDVGSVLTALDGSRALLNRASALWGRVPQAGKERQRFVLGAAAVLIGPPVLAVLVALVAQKLAPHTAAIASTASWLSATAAAAAHWLRERNAQVARHLGEVESLHALASRRVEEARQEFHARVAGLEREIELRRTEVAAAQVDQRAASERLESLKRELAETTPASVLADFVRERAGSDDYRKYLGLPAVIRRDFQSISSMLETENRGLEDVNTLEQEKVGAAQRINRIVLYIDDLDRCNEALVVEVLQAVHLLLAFPLFVVVVAVDARWLTRSLATRFPGLLGATQESGGQWSGADADHATTDDYLEKIFQIPFWLRPPSDIAARKMLRSLVPESVPAAAPVAGDIAPTVHESGTAAVAPAAVFKEGRHDPHAKALDIGSVEMAYIERAAPLLDHSPRALKRFVNVYRLLKASLGPEDEFDFTDDPGSAAAGQSAANPLDAPFKRVLWLLAIASGQHALGGALFEALVSDDPPPAASKQPVPPSAGPGASVEELMDRLTKRAGTVADEARQVIAWLDAYSPGGSWKKAPPKDLRHWVPRVSRYSYHLFRGG